MARPAQQDHGAHALAVARRLLRLREHAREDRVHLAEVARRIHRLGERRLILATLESFEGDKKKTADVLKISLKTLYNRLNEYKTA